MPKPPKVVPITAAKRSAQERVEKRTCFPVHAGHVTSVIECRQTATRIELRFLRPQLGYNIRLLEKGLLEKTEAKAHCADPDSRPHRVIVTWPAAQAPNCFDVLRPPRATRSFLIDR